MSRSLILSILLLIAAIFSAGEGIRISLKEIPPVSISALPVLVEVFKQDRSPEATIHLDAIFANFSSEELVHPKNALPRYTHFPIEEVRTLFEYRKSCKVESLLKFSSGELKKAFLWEQFVCGEKSSLGSEFWSSEFKMHPSGRSYAYLYLEHAKDQSSLDTIKRHFHIMEWVEIVESDPFPLLRGLAHYEWAALIHENNHVLTSNLVFLRKEGGGIQNPRTYDVFFRDDWNRFFAKTFLQPIKSTENDLCLEHESTICWKTHRGTQDKQAHSWLIASGAILFGWLFLQLFLFIHSRRREKAESQRRLFILQTMAHELRTPIASLKMAIEQLRKDFDQLSDRGQDGFLRASSDISRLSKIASASQQYLASSNSSKLLSLQEIEIPSIKEFVCEMLPEISGSISGEDFSLKTDPYWLSICLRNLYENAERHGEKPISVSLFRENDLRIEVIDQGQGEISEEFFKEFQKNSSSAGMGLGLSITKKVIASLGATIETKSRPTRFAIVWPKEKK